MVDRSEEKLMALMEWMGALFGLSACMRPSEGVVRGLARGIVGR